MMDLDAVLLQQSQMMGRQVTATGAHVGTLRGVDGEEHEVALVLYDTAPTVGAGFRAQESRFAVIVDGNAVYSGSFASRIEPDRETAG